MCEHPRCRRSTTRPTLGPSGPSAFDRANGPAFGWSGRLVFRACGLAVGRADWLVLGRACGFACGLAGGRARGRRRDAVALNAAGLRSALSGAGCPRRWPFVCSEPPAVAGGLMTGPGGRAQAPGSRTAPFIAGHRRPASPAADPDPRVGGSSNLLCRCRVVSALWRRSQPSSLTRCRGRPSAVLRLPALQGKAF